MIDSNICLVDFVIQGKIYIFFNLLIILVQPI